MPTQHTRNQTYMFKNYSSKINPFRKQWIISLSIVCHGGLGGKYTLFLLPPFFSLTWCSLTSTMCKNRWMLLFKSMEYVMRTQIIIVMYHFNIFFSKTCTDLFINTSFFLRSHLWNLGHLLNFIFNIYHTKILPNRSEELLSCSTHWWSLK